MYMQNYKVYTIDDRLATYVHIINGQNSMCRLIQILIVDENPYKFSNRNYQSTGSSIYVGEISHRQAEC